MATWPYSLGYLLNDYYVIWGGGVYSRSIEAEFLMMGLKIAFSTSSPSNYLVIETDPSRDIYENVFVCNIINAMVLIKIKLESN